MAISPAGNQVAFLARQGNIRQLYLRDLDSLEAKPIPGTEDTTCTPFFSPDGQWLAFYAAGALKKVSLQGGTPVTVSNIGGFLGASWGDDNTIVFSELARSGIARVSASGGTPENITQVDTSKGEANHRYPVLLPGSKAVLFSIAMSGRGDNVQIVVQRLDTGERKVLIEGGTFPSYAPTGHLVYVREGAMMAVPFDLERLEVTGDPVPMSEAVQYSPVGAAQFRLSSMGSLVYVPGVPGRPVAFSLVWVDRKGDFQVLDAPQRYYQFLRLSPDGRQVAVTIRGFKDDIWVYDIPLGAMTRLTFAGNNAYPLWTPDGKRIVFLSSQVGSFNLFWKPADGTGAEEQITQGEHRYLHGSISPDGSLAAFAEIHPAQGQDIWMIPLGGQKPSLFLQTPTNESAPMISPDGRWLAYASNESGRFEIYARAFPGPGGKWQISTEGGREPVWARSGRELFYRNGDKMMALEIATEPSFRAGTPRLLFEKRYERSASTDANYDVSPDGQHFLMIREGGSEPPPTQINVVVNWFEDLKRRFQ